MSEPEIEFSAIGGTIGPMKYLVIGNELWSAKMTKNDDGTWSPDKDHPELPPGRYAIGIENSGTLSLTLLPEPQSEPQRSSLVR